jgi:hypothetical protein
MRLKKGFESILSMIKDMTNLWPKTFQLLNIEQSSFNPQESLSLKIPNSFTFNLDSIEQEALTKNASDRTQDP